MLLHSQMESDPASLEGESAPETVTFEGEFRGNLFLFSQISQPSVCAQPPLAVWMRTDSLALKIAARLKVGREGERKI